MKDRRRARRLALDALYQAEIRGQLPTEAWAAQLRETLMADDEVPSADEGPSEEALRYAGVLIAGVQEHAAEIDERIVRAADRWALDRMALVDKNLLRLALFELLWLRDVPIPVVINEAIELAKSLSTEESGTFINGILGRVASESRQPAKPEGSDS